MLAMRFLTISWIAAVHLAEPPSAKPVPEARPPDTLCQLLFDQYVRGVKVDDSDRYAAYHLIASRGRNNGFIDFVWEEFRKGGDQFLELRYVQILGKVLEVDAGARDAIEAQKRGQYHGAWMPSIALDDSVVPELIERAKRANRRGLTTYLIALSGARDARSEAFFQEVLRKREKATSQESDQFHAAVGLARLGDSSGVEWLIEHVDDKEGDVYGAWPERVSDFQISTCCRAVLRDLSELPVHTTRDHWRVWFQQQQGKFGRINRIRLVGRF